MKTATPRILESALRRDAMYGEAISTGDTDMAIQISEGFKDELKKYCKAVYETTAASMMRGKAQMALWFKDSGGKLILPGNTCKFVSQGKDIYYGYIDSVIHSMSTSGENSTTVAMSRVRPGPNYEVGGTSVINIGAPNAAYE